MLSRETANKMLHSWARQVLTLVQASYKVQNNTPLKLESGRSYILMSNHQSYYDIPLLYMSIPEGSSLRMIGKKELFRIPLWGRAMKTAEFISIDRSDHEKSMESMETAKDKMKSGVMIYVAPEGTRSRDAKLREFKKGGFMLAIQTESIIIPVGIRGTERIMPPDSWDFSLGQKIEAHVGTPIDAANYSEAERDILMQEVRKQILSLAKKPE
ncbi:MAG: 1-acyl-sn-glycerol-3-phosphate acyltransferase [SAR324 cluster bacterium]|nr:1-acyl-sn-glycerol-3-phosphate acyltransferase [SAR324 cluster bacterium]MBL7035722.1 1-acyl-sn-glycerol-3-phosphate acyltransferase [SAR324 cluster bacterium]